MRANRSSRRPLGVLLVAAVAVMALALPTSALAQDPTDTEYDPAVQLEVAASNAGGSNNGGDNAAPTSSASSLPFTGLDLAAFAAIGVGLVGAGFVIRRAAKTGQ
jgi:hypothetical protein